MINLGFEDSTVIAAEEVVTVTNEVNTEMTSIPPQKSINIVPNSNRLSRVDSENIEAFELKKYFYI